MPLTYIAAFAEITIESILFTAFLFRRMDCRNPMDALVPSKRCRHTAAWDARAWKAMFCFLTILSGSIVHLFLEPRIHTAMLQALSFLLRMLLVSLFFQNTMFDKAFHICLLCFLSLFSGQAACLAEYFYSNVYLRPVEQWLSGVYPIQNPDFFWRASNTIRNTLFYLGSECLILLLFLFALRDISKLSEKAYGFLIAVTAAALFVSTYFLSRVLGLDPNLLPIRYQAQFYLINLLILILFLSILLLNQITGKAFSENMELAEELHLREKNEERNKALLQSAESLQRWKHDYKNHLIAMKGLLEDGAYRQLQEYILGQLESLPEAFPTVNTGHRVVDAILTNKIALAKNAGAAFRHSVLLPEQMPLNDIELTGVLGNLLDNAIEACQKIPGDGASISFAMKPKRGMLYIGVENSSLGEYLYRPDGALETTKEEKETHGKGLSNVEGIVEAHAGFCQVHAKQDSFEAVVYIPM